MLKDEGGVLTGPMASELGQEFGVSTRISPHDYLLNALLWAFKGDIVQAFRNYIEDGRRNALQVKEVFAKYPPQRPAGEKLRVLDFASGYARVGRHFPVVAPEWVYTAMDIHPQAVAFNREELGLTTLLSHYDPDQMRMPQRFDAIFALSFFSHMRREHFVPWLEALHRMLEPGGVLLFTTHGRHSHDLTMTEAGIDADGYGMIDASEQHDLSKAYYIHAITYEPFVRKAVAAVSGLELFVFEEKAWWGHQDMYLVRCTAAAPAMATGRALASDLRRIFNGIYGGARGALRPLAKAVRRRQSEA